MRTLSVAAVLAMSACSLSTAPNTSPTIQGKPTTTEPAIGGSETVSYILEQATARGAEFTSEQVHAVVETQLAYLRAIGAVGTKADDFDDD